MAVYVTYVAERRDTRENEISQIRYLRAESDLNRGCLALGCKGNDKAANSTTLLHGLPPILPDDAGGSLFNNEMKIESSIFRDFGQATSISMAA